MSSKTPVLLLGFALLSPACGEPGAPVAAAVRAPAPAGALALPAASGRVLRAYSFDGVVEVPWFSGAPPPYLFPGELGRTPLTGLYLTFNAPLATEAAAQPAGWSVSALELASGPGRFGAGASLGASSLLRCELAPAARAARAWTLEFWLRPERIAARELLAVPGLMRLACSSEGRLTLALPSDAAAPQKSLRNPKALVAGEWSHVAVVLDLVDAHALRLVVDGEAQSLPVDPASLATLPPEIRLGDVDGRSSGLECALDELRFEGRNLGTAELARHWRREDAALERVRLTYAPAGAGTPPEEELELWRAPLTDPRLDSAEEWARGELVHAFASERGLTWTSEHWRALTTADAPVARTTHPVVALGGGRVFTFGGETRDTHCGPTATTNDTWIFDDGAARWSRVATIGAPSPRCHVPAAYSPDHDLVLLVGGWWLGGWWGGPDEREERVYGDTWVYHVSEGRWEPRTPSGCELHKVTDEGLVYLPEQRRFLLVFGRRCTLYDPERDAFECLPPFEVVNERGEPVPRQTLNSVSCALDPATGLVLIYGGCYGPDNETFVDSTGFYDVRANRLTLLDLPLAPPARVRSGLGYDPARRRFVLFGGVREQHSPRFDDLWTFDPRARCWTEVERGARRPMARGGYYGMAYDEVADRFVLPLGRNASNRWLDETWTLELDEHRAGSARYVFDRAAFPLERAWFAEVEASAGAEVRFRFKTSADGLRFGEWRDECPLTGRFVQVEVVLAPGPDGARPCVRAMGFRAPA